MELNHILPFLLSALLLLAVELVYFRVAMRYGIVDKPNGRSSHVRPAIRGGGVVFVLGVLVWFFQSDAWPWFVLGALAIAVISFLDDVISLNPLVRFPVHLVAVLLLFYQIAPTSWPVYLIAVAVIFCIGTLNAFNFMDGINGITGVYALVSLASLGFIQIYLVPFTDLSLVIVVSISVLIFLFFNFRNRASCFAGDVGSITIAFVLIFLLLQLIHATHNFLWPLLFLVYGTDSIVTIIYRIRRGENIFKPHRTHLFQYLSNELKWPHRVVAVAYGALQALFNLILFYALPRNEYALPLIAAVVFVVGYLLIRTLIVRQIQKGLLN
jgi:UDP-N-acetylmuramyl pentapeptide phosphotransferase/UDP-N-acetylglucosamine-1-phosphate transferase